ncbi:MAG TPA: hypothetical protein PK802_07215 [Candidatus Cloacimonadota bacterium]|jgi:hypothetical protein|nr:hypothetical protein [Candidatus Cloacimonadota bacterium]HOG31082.1 hypothetical protein [Candidatus Cloacimonadota bacterium]HOR59071.1 hypothetical protein [Candidatus Cloacimonadota bacterium]HPB09461.1 hypothetical protein [Candidatus Cloacimonadota bacterium]HPL23444.1 hypothetical protein [Candidatus Cloacimonadota bacterium]
MSKNDKRLHLGKVNFLLLILAAVLLIVGYVIMSFNEITISPILLLLVYAFLIPFALLYKNRPKE